MVWADFRTRTDYSHLQLDLGKALTHKLDEILQPKKESKKEQAITVTNPASVVRYQREHPEVNSLPIAEVAPRLRSQRIFFFQAEDGIRDVAVTGVQTCALPIWDGWWLRRRYLSSRQRRDDADRREPGQAAVHLGSDARPDSGHGLGRVHRAAQRSRSEERRVGKECRSRWSPYHKTKTVKKEKDQ